MESTTKRCPAGAEEIQAAAVICRYCKHDFTRARELDFVKVPMSRLSIASLALGITWLFWVGSFAAIVVGVSARKEVKASNGELQGLGIANAGITLGWIGVAFLILTVFSG